MLLLTLSSDQRGCPHPSKEDPDCVAICSDYGVGTAGDVCNSACTEYTAQHCTPQLIFSELLIQAVLLYFADSASGFTFACHMMKIAVINRYFCAFFK